MDQKVYLGLGSNLGLSSQIVKEALNQISCLQNISGFQKSPLFQSSPVSDIDQPSFVNAVCSFDYLLADPHPLFQQLRAIERGLGKFDKPKNFPRYIDIDILLFQSRLIKTDALSIPHPKMLERLFVLKPLSTLTSHISYPEAREKKEIFLPPFIKNFKNIHLEVVKKIGDLDK